MDNFQGNLSQNSFGHSQQRNHQPNHRVHQTYGAAPNAASAMDPNAANRGYYQGGVPMYFPGPSGFNNGLALQSGNAWNSSPPSRSSQFVPIAPRPPQNVQLSQTYVHPDNRTWNGIPMLEGRTSVLMQHLIDVSVENQCYLRYIAHPQFPPQLGLGYAKIIDTNDYLARHANDSLKLHDNTHAFALEGVQAQDAIVTLIYNFGFTKNDPKDRINRMDPAKAMKYFFDLDAEFQWIRREPIEGEWSTFVTRSFGTVVCGFFKGDGPPLLAPIKSNETSWRIADDGQWMPGSAIDVTGRYEAKHPEMVKFIGAEWGRHVLQSKKWLPGPDVKMEYWDRSMPMGDMDVIIPLYRNHLKQQEERNQEDELKGKTKAGGKGKGVDKEKGKAADMEDDEDAEDLEEQDAMEMRYHSMLTDITDPPSEDPHPSSPYTPDEFVPSPTGSNGDDAMDGDYKD